MACVNGNVLRTVIMLATVTVLLTCAAGCSDGQNGNTQSTPPSVTTKTDVGDTYPLKTCVVSGEPLDEFGDPVIVQYEGREVRFCCGDCSDAFKQAPSQYMALLDAGASGADDTRNH